MFYVSDKQVEPEKSRILYSHTFTEAVLKEDFTISSGEWRVQDGWLYGLCRENAGGIIYLKQEFLCDVILDFYAEMIPPCKNDLNFTWRTEGWDYAKNDAGAGYIGGFGGWWTGRTGVEKYPECKVQALTSLITPESGRMYQIQAGIIGDMCFIVVDGVMAVEMRDPGPFDAEKHPLVGLGTYCSHIRFRDFKVAEPYWTQVELAYDEI